MLKLNDDKTELIVFASCYNQDLYSDVSMMIGNTTVVCEPQVKNLGVIFDQVMSMRQYVNYTSRTALFHLRNISRIRRYIPEESCKLVVQSLITSRLDYSNGLLYGSRNLFCSLFKILLPHQDCFEGIYNTCSQRAALVASGQENWV